MKPMTANTIEGATRIITGDWCLEVHTAEKRNKVARRFGTGYRRYHRHKNVWYCVVSSPDTLGGVTPAEGESGHGWKCGHCGEPVPADMEGYIKLARYSLDDN
jgi:hypothetical protein